jgi:hypothetical protein
MFRTCTGSAAGPVPVPGLYNPNDLGGGRPNASVASNRRGFAFAFAPEERFPPAEFRLPVDELLGPTPPMLIPIGFPPGPNNAAGDASRPHAPVRAPLFNAPFGPPTLPFPLPFRGGKSDELAAELSWPGDARGIWLFEDEREARRSLLSFELDDVVRESGGSGRRPTAQSGRGGRGCLDVVDVDV